MSGFFILKFSFIVSLLLQPVLAVTAPIVALNYSPNFAPIRVVPAVQHGHSLWHLVTAVAPCPPFLYSKTYLAPPQLRQRGYFCPVFYVLKIGRASCRERV